MKAIWVNHSVWEEIPSTYGNIPLKDPEMKRFLEIISPKLKEET